MFGLLFEEKADDDDEEAVDEVDEADDEAEWDDDSTLGDAKPLVPAGGGRNKDGENLDAAAA